MEAMPEPLRFSPPDHWNAFPEDVFWIDNYFCWMMFSLEEIWELRVADSLLTARALRIPPGKENPRLW
jgi:hypothetical protein